MEGIEEWLQSNAIAMSKKVADLVYDAHTTY